MRPMTLCMNLFICFVFSIFFAIYSVLPAAAAGKYTLAVIPFENITRKPDLDWLSMGISETINNDLMAVEGLVLIERLQLRKILEEQQLHLTGIIDEKTVVKIGKLMGANILVVGGFQKMNDQIRLTARFVDVETGGILQTAKVTGKMDEIFELQDRIVAKLAKNLNIELKKQEIAKIGTAPTKSLKAYQHFGQGALLQARKNYQGAAKELARATEIDPDFSAAIDMLKEVFWSLDKGNYWTYETKTRITDDTTMEMISEMTRRSGGLESFNGRNVFSYMKKGETKVMVTGKAMTVPIEQTLYYFKGEDGIYWAGQKVLSSGTGTIYTCSPPPLSFPFKFSKGRSWKDVFINKVDQNGKPLAASQATLSSKIIGVEEVEVSAGKFKAFVVEVTFASKAKPGYKYGTDSHTEYTCWFAPGVGIVKTVSRTEMVILNKKTVTLIEETLKKYHIE
ncbi:MAG: CsgG/HfaB family protein [Thermodesulfobacteriota bacterium]|nr:CsgG/HfaB family protein [Thermodesulfobacteriota bacterium]